MSVCRVCNAPITWGLNTSTGTRVPLDDHEVRDSGPDRYIITVEGDPPKVAPIGESSTLRTYVDHRAICQQPRAI